MTRARPGASVTGLPVARLSAVISGTSVPTARSVSPSPESTGASGSPTNVTAPTSGIPAPPNAMAGASTAWTAPSGAVAAPTGLFAVSSPLVRPSTISARTPRNRIKPATSASGERNHSPPPSACLDWAVSSRDCSVIPRSLADVRVLRAAPTRQCQSVRTTHRSSHQDPLIARRYRCPGKSSVGPW